MINDMQQSIIVVCEAFTNNPDGSWTSIKNTDIQTSQGSIRIGPGMVFRKDRPMWGVDIVRTLDESCLRSHDS
jgi:hypothetical protein